MKYYLLVDGDYVQSGDEYEKDGLWLPVTSNFFGKKYGYDPKQQGIKRRWLKIRRQVPFGFSLPVVDMP